MTKLMRGASAESLETLTRVLDDTIRDGADGAALGPELFAVAAMLHGEGSLRRVLTDRRRANGPGAGDIGECRA